jgi:hypothetical protein
MKRKELFMLLAALMFTGTAMAQFADYKFKEPTHYLGVKNTGVNMTVGIPETAWDIAPEEGDEIAAFNAIGQLVGSIVFLGGNTAITVWGDDETTLEKEGVADEGRFTLKIWRKDGGKEESIEVEHWIEGNDLYATNAISVIGKLKVKPTVTASGEYQLAQNMPNPAKNLTVIEYFIPADANVLLAIYSPDGKLVREVVNKQHTAGSYSVEIKINDLPAGNYFYKLNTEEFSAVKSMSVIR